jgi:transposase
MVKYKVVLNADELLELKQITSRGHHSARTIKRAKILLMAHSGNYSEEEIAKILSISLTTIYRSRRYFVEYGLSDALYDDPRTGQPRKLDGNKEALLIAMACSKPPKGRCRWTLSMLGDQLISLTELDAISPELSGKD